MCSSQRAMSALNFVFELPYISRPAVILEESLCGCSQVHCASDSVTFQKMLDQKWNILRSISKGRELKLNHVKPIPEVLSKSSFSYHLFERAVSGTDNPRIGT